MDNNNIDRKSFDEQRRKKAENFHLNISEDALGAPPAGDEARRNQLLQRTGRKGADRPRISKIPEKAQT